MEHTKGASATYNTSNSRQQLIQVYTSFLLPSFFAAVKYKGKGCSTNFKMDGHHTKYTTRDPPPYERTKKRDHRSYSERRARRARSEHGGVNSEQQDLSVDERGMTTTASAAAFASSSSSSSSSRAPKQSRGGGGAGGGAGGGKRRGGGKKKRKASSSHVDSRPSNRRGRGAHGDGGYGGYGDGYAEYGGYGGGEGEGAYYYGSDYSDQHSTDEADRDDDDHPHASSYYQNPGDGGDGGDGAVRGGRGGGRGGGQGGGKRGRREGAAADGPVMYKGEGDDDDDNLEYCAVCSRGSSADHPLFCCEGCPTSYHAACLPTEDFDRVDLWTCPDCRVAFNVIEKGSAEGELKGVKLRQRRAFLRVHGWGLEISSASGHYRYTSPDKSFHTGKVPRAISNYIMFSVIE